MTNEEKKELTSVAEWERISYLRSVYYGYVDTQFKLRGIRGIDMDGYRTGLRMRQRSECLPCPFCGDKNVQVYTENGEDYEPDTYKVECNCGASTNNEKSEIEAIQTWNKRVK
jgi:Lar family restriction alleviation protein